MAVIIKLGDVIDALDFPEEWEAWLDPATGEIITLSEEDRSLLDDEEAHPNGLQDWEREPLARARRALQSPGMLQLPDKFEVHEWDIMRRFSHAQDEPASAELLNAIHGPGAFRMFRSTIDRLDLRSAWFQFRADAFRGIAVEWLEHHGIEYVDDRSRTDAT
ncbi:MAG TPA: UPF0158 family protein [Longimicrobiales bacterium]|nr:UPF0158 family protein [Longimicrobiales bacterium]